MSAGDWAATAVCASSFALWLAGMAYQWRKHRRREKRH